MNEKLKVRREIIVLNAKNGVATVIEFQGRQYVLQNPDVFRTRVLRDGKELK